MKLTFIGAAHEVTGSCHYLEACGKHILIDCGLEQGPDLYENQEIPINPSMIDYILLTHAHIDHSGKIPLLVKNGFKGEIICTFATSDLCSIMLRDSAHIQESEAEWRNRKALRSGAPLYEPLYTVQDAMNAVALLRRSIITRRSSSVKESNSASQMSVICLVLPALKSGSQKTV